MKKFFKKYGFLILIIFFAILRFFLTKKLTISERQDLGVDDNWVVFTAYSLKNHSWQGIYCLNTMIKGITGPLILAFSSSIGISYLGIVNLMYIIAVISFVYSVKDIIKNRYMLFVIYIAMLFNPIMYGADIVQRIYRNSFVPSLSVFIASLYFFILSHKESSRTDLVLYFIITGVFVALFFNLREDAIWILPFIIFVSIFIFVNMYKQNKKVFLNLLILLIPALITTMLNLTICTINYKYYGVFQRLDFSLNTSFSKVIFYIQKIDYDGQTNRVSVTMDKMEKLCSVSPSLNKNKEVLLKYIKQYGNLDSARDDGEIDNGYLGWAIRSATYEAGEYETTIKARDYYNKVYEELKQAESEGKFTLSKNRYNFENIKTLVKTIFETSNYVVNFKEIETDMDIKSIYYGNYFGIMTEEIAKNRRIYTDEDIETYKLSNSSDQEEYLQKYGKLEYILNGITNIYRNISLPIFAIAFIVYLVISFKFIFKKKSEYKNFWIVSSGLLGAIFTLVCGIAFTDVYSCNSIGYSYLSGTYAFLIAFEFIGICYFIKFIANKLKKSKEGI